MKFEQMPSQADLEKSRKLYEKEAKSTAKSVNGFVDHLLGRGISKSDVMHIDALAENQARNENDEKKLERQGLLDEIEKVEVVDKGPDEERKQFKFIIEGRQIELNFQIRRKYEFRYPDKSALTGDLKFDEYNHPDNQNVHDYDQGFIRYVKGKIDGVEISYEDASELLRKYGDLINERYLEQVNLKKDIKEQK